MKYEWLVKEDKGEIGVGEDERVLELTEVFNSVILKTGEGNRLALCMRDDTIEMKVVGSSVWHRVNMETGIISPMRMGTIDREEVQGEIGNCNGG